MSDTRDWLMRNVARGAVLAVAGIVSACAPPVPDSGAGVGFGDYDSYRQQREAELAGTRLPAPAGVQSGALAPAGTVPPQAAPSAPSAPPPDDDSAEALAARTQAALNSGRAPVVASPSNPAPDLNNPGISDENSFEAVSNRQSIESDAERLARQRAAYRVIEPTALPPRTGDIGPNIVEYALRTSNPVGTQVYSRGGFNAERKYRMNCAAYASPDLAQSDFLAKGGPEKDRMGLDPDGDGYACRWDPTPFRQAVRR